MQCIEETCYDAQRAVLGVDDLLKGTSAMPRMWTTILQLLVHSILFWSKRVLKQRPSSPQAKAIISITIL